MMHKELFRQIPSLDYLLETPTSQQLIKQSSRTFVRDCLRQVLEQLRSEISQEKLPLTTDIVVLIAEKLQQLWQQRQKLSLRPVINATGTLLHTNLGRAPLAEEALQEIMVIASGYSNLEYDLNKGGRGHRDGHCEALLKAIVGCEASVIVNNNAAAVMLVLDELARGGEAIISRGEMIEIGGAFRIPDVMAKSGATLREVGTTNRTRLADYQAAITPQTRVILRVHPSNYRIIGFTEKPSLTELVALAHQHKITLIEDLGSGCLVDLTSCGIKDEPTAQASIAAGVDLITFSGDKMLGGPQAGIIAGRAEYIAQIRRNPLMRALRVDKLCYSALAATLQLYQLGTAWQTVPLLRALKATPTELQARAQALVRRVRRRLPPQSSLKLVVKSGYSLIGAGSAPEQRLPTVLIALISKERSASSLEIALRKHDPPVIARIDEDMLVIDIRTILPQDEPHLLAAIINLA